MQSKQALFSLLHACTSLKHAKQLYGQMITRNLAGEVVLLNKLLPFIAISEDGDLDFACMIFSRIHQPNIFMWNVMIRGHSLYDKPQETLLFFKGMQRAGLSPNNYTYPFLLKSCALLSEFNHGEGIHGHAMKSGFEMDVFVSTALLHLYGSSENMESAYQLFVQMPERNVVSWTTMISSYVHCGNANDAIRVFKEMQEAGAQPNHFTLGAVLTACAQTGDLEMGRFVDDCIKRNRIKKEVVLGTALLDMYAKCGRLDISRQLFDGMRERNVVSWNTMICAYNQANQYKDAMSLFNDMRNEHIKSDEVTLLGVSTACAQLGDRGLGQGIHAHVEKNNFNKNGALGTALIDMYSKSGDTDSAIQIFHSILYKDEFTWTAMISGLAMHGHGKDALDLFEEMLREGTKPDEVTYMGVLSACRHVGLVEKGCEYFHLMKTVHEITPKEEHYGCMVDLLSRAGLLKEAEMLIESIPVTPCLAIYSALLNGCRIYGNADMAQRITKRIVQLNPQTGDVHVLISNVYAKEGRWHGVKMARELMKEKGVMKSPGCSLIRGNGDTL